jgi:hypothetical protein
VHLRQSGLLRTIGDLTCTRGLIDNGLPADPPDATHQPMHGVITALRSQLGHLIFDTAVRTAADSIPDCLRPPPDWPGPDATAYSPGQQLRYSSVLARLLGWRLPSGQAVPLGDLSVKTATLLQLSALNGERDQRHQVFLAETYAPAARPQDALKNLRHRLRELWAVALSNQRKELYWRLLLNGLPTSQRMHLSDAASACPCGPTPLPGRTHHFWECPAAQAIVSELQRVVGTPLTREHVWLLTPPATVQADVWQVVALSALHAMWVAKGALMVPRRRNRYRGPPSGLVPHATAQGVEAFWGFLHEFAVLGRPPSDWVNTLVPGSPFLHYPSPSTGIRVHRA